MNQLAYFSMQTAKEIEAFLARSPERIFEISDVVLCLLAASVVHSAIREKANCPDLSILRETRGNHDGR
jgi:hypothetical protein